MCVVLGVRLGGERSFAQRCTVTGAAPVSMTCSLQWTTQWRSLVWLTRTDCAWAAGAMCVTLIQSAQSLVWPTEFVATTVSAGRHPDESRHH